MSELNILIFCYSSQPDIMLSDENDDDDENDDEPPKKNFFFDPKSSYNNKRKRNNKPAPSKPNIYSTVSNVRNSNKSAQEKAKMLQSAARKK